MASSTVWVSKPPRLAKKICRLRPSDGPAEMSLAIICSCVPREVAGKVVVIAVALLSTLVSREASLIAELVSLEALSRASPDLAAFRDAAERFPGTGARFALHLYVRVDGDATRLRTRMFGPLVGVLEDPATGSANAALAALLVGWPCFRLSGHYYAIATLVVGMMVLLLVTNWDFVNAAMGITIPFRSESWIQLQFRVAVLPPKSTGEAVTVMRGGLAFDGRPPSIDREA